MKSKKILFILFYYGIFYLPVDAQMLNPELFKKFNSSVITKVHDLVSNVPLNYSRQMKLAKIYAQEDSALLSAIKQGAKPYLIDSIRAQTILNLSNLLSVTEIENCFIARHQSQFMDVLFLKNKVKLTQYQLDTLIVLDSIMKSKLQIDPMFNAGLFERKSLTNVLSSEQYNNYLKIRTKKDALEIAAKDWNELADNHIVDPNDSLKLIKAIINYNVARTSAIDRYQDVRVLQNEKLREIERVMPQMLRDLEDLRKIKKKAAEDSIQYWQKNKDVLQ